MRNEEIPESELQLVKNVLTGQFARGLEDPRTIAQYALNIARYGLPKDYYKTYLERLNQVTTAEIREAANKYIDPERLQIFVDRKSTRLNSSHVAISYAVFCLKKKK